MNSNENKTQSSASDYEFAYQLNYDERSYTVTDYKGNAKRVVIPDSFAGKPVSILFDKLFSGHSEIEAVVIPDSVTDLGEFLFDGCMNLHHITLPPNLMYLWGYAFARCGLEEVTLPDTLKRIPPYCFKECSQLKKVICGSGLKKIDSWAFGGCDQLTELIHGPDVEISPVAFEMNESILKI